MTLLLVPRACAMAFGMGLGVESPDFSGACLSGAWGDSPGLCGSSLDNESFCSAAGYDSAVAQVCQANVPVLGGICDGLAGVGLHPPQGTHEGHPYGRRDAPPRRGWIPDYSGMIRHRRTGSPRGGDGGEGRPGYPQGAPLRGRGVSGETLDSRVGARE